MWTLSWSNSHVEAMPSITRCEAAQQLVHANRRAGLVELRSLANPNPKPRGAQTTNRGDRTRPIPLPRADRDDDGRSHTHTIAQAPRHLRTSHARVHRCRKAHHETSGALAQRQNGAHRHRRTYMLTQSLAHSRTGHVCVGTFRDRVGAQMDWSSQPTKGLWHLTPHTKVCEALVPWYRRPLPVQ